MRNLKIYLFLVLCLVFSFRAHAEAVLSSGNSSSGGSSSGGGSTAISALTSAQGSNSIDNSTFQQTWNWSGITTGAALKIAPSALTSGVGFWSQASANTGGAGNPISIEGILRVGNNGANTGYAGYFQNATTGAGYGIYSQITSQAGTDTGYAGYFSNTDTTSVSYGIYSADTSATGYAGYFNGAVNVSGALTVSSCSGCGGISSGTTGRIAQYTSSSAVGAATALSISTTNAKQINFLDNVTTAGLIGIPDTGLDFTSISVGASALLSETASNLDNVGVGYQALTGITTAARNVGVGYQAGNNASNTGVDNIFVGYQAGKNNTSAGASVIIGSGAGANITNTGNEVLIGYQADSPPGNQLSTAVGASTKVGTQSVVVGANSGFNNGSVSTSSVFVGEAMATSATGANNVGIGQGALITLGAGANNVVVGQGSDTALSTTTSGVSVGHGTKVGSTDLAAGDSALRSTTTNNNHNTALGFSALASVTSGTNNIAVGYNDGGTLTIGSNNIYFGNSLAAVTTTDANTMNLNGLWTATGTNTASTASNTLNGLYFMPNIATDNTHTDTAVCVDSTSHQLLFGSGTLGVCLGTSSIRFKHGISPLADGLGEVIDLKPINFYYNKDHGDPDKKQNGFLAEDVATVLPSLVGLDKEGKPNNVDLLGMIPVVVRAIQQQQQEISVMSGAGNHVLVVGHKCFFGLLICAD